MKVYSIFINDTKGFFLVAADNEQVAIAHIFEDEDSPLFEDDADNYNIDAYEEKNLSTDLEETTTMSWLLNYNY